MKYCIEYASKFKYLDEVDEILINFNRQDDALPAFLKKFKSKTVIINIDRLEDFGMEDIGFFETLYSLYSNFKLRLNFYRHKDFVSEFSNVPYFFNIYAPDWQKLHYLLRYNPTDIYITDNLGFEIEKVAKVLHLRGVQIRVTPNLAQSADIEAPSIYKFFIRPEDTKDYEGLIDVYEFISYEGRKQESTYYEIYNKNKSWKGDLNMLIINFEEPIDNQSIFPSFARRRRQCGQKCLKGDPCAFCEKVISFSKTLAEKNLIIY